MALNLHRFPSSSWTLGRALVEATKRTTPATAFPTEAAAQQFRFQWNSFAKALRFSPDPKDKELGTNLSQIEVIMRRGDGLPTTQSKRGRQSGSQYENLTTELWDAAKEAAESVEEELKLIPFQELWFLFFRLRLQSKAGENARRMAERLLGKWSNEGLDEQAKESEERLLNFLDKEEQKQKTPEGPPMTSDQRATQILIDNGMMKEPPDWPFKKPAK